MFQSGELVEKRSKNDLAKLYQHYADLERHIHVTNLGAKTTYRSPVNFVESMQQPRHRWFPYKEGFSPSFVRGFLNEFDQSSGLVFDPFSGSGTTPLVAAEMGRRSMGFDVSPLTNFVAATKARILSSTDCRKFQSQIHDFANSPLSGMSLAPSNKTVCRYFLPHYLDALLRIKHYFLNIEDERFSDLFKLAFLGAIEPFSTHRKAGNGVKKKTRHSFEQNAAGALEHVRKFILTQLDIYHSDILATPKFNGAMFRQASSIDQTQYESLNDISCVLTSPPYANCFDYSKIYMSELWLGDFFQAKEDQKAFRVGSVRSHVHAAWDDRNSSLGSDIVDNVIRKHVESQDLWSPRIGTMLAGYFQDLGKLLSTVKPHLAHKAHLGFVVGNSFYGGVAVATDLLLADLATKHGYSAEEIRIYRGVIPSSQQYSRLGENQKYMRESLVVIRSN